MKLERYNRNFEDDLDTIERRLLNIQGRLAGIHGTLTAITIILGVIIAVILRTA